jgi:1-acyl-sn-glycerol-3-phosphate acyltransferase
MIMVMLIVGAETADAQGLRSIFKSVTNIGSGVAVPWNNPNEMEPEEYIRRYFTKVAAISNAKGAEAYRIHCNSVQCRVEYTTDRAARIAYRRFVSMLSSQQRGVFKKRNVLVMNSCNIVEYNENPENEVFGEPYIVCSNHTSMADAVLIMASMKNQVSYMAKKEAFKGFGWFFRAMGAIPVDRSGGDVGAIKKTLNVLKNGDSVGIFPQGTRRPYQNPRDTEIKDGVGMLASRAGVGVLPVFVKTKAGKVKLFRKTEIIIGEYIKPEELCFDGLSGKEKYKKISEYVFDKVCLIGENTEEK